MARKNANSSPRVWLGLLLVLVGHTVALSTFDEKTPEREKLYQFDDSLKSAHSGSKRVVSPIAKLPINVHESVAADSRDFYNDKQSDELNDLKKSAHSSEPDSAKKIDKNEELGKENTTPGSPSTSTRSSETMSDDTTNRYEKTTIENTEEKPQGDRLVKSANLQDYKNANKIPEESQNETLHASQVKSSTTSRQELEFAEEHVDFEDHTSSELAEGTTPSSTSSGAGHRTKPTDSNKNTESFDLDQSNDHHGVSNATISLADDTNVNYHQRNNNSRDLSDNDTLINDNGVSSGHELEHRVEIFNVTSYPSSLRIIEETERESTVIIDNTTPDYSVSKPKGRTISITGDNDLSEKMAKDVNDTNGHQATSDTIMRIVPKKSASTEKPTELKPYPYVKSETKFTDNDEMVTEKPNKTEESTEEIAAYENTIGRKGTDEKIVVTEPSVLVDNSIQQFKPIHNKRSGNSSRVNSTLDNPVASTAWSLPTTEDLAPRHVTGLTEESQATVVDIGNRSQINNDVPQDNPNNSVTTERSRVIFSEVTENNIETIGGKINGTSNLTASTTAFKQLTEHSDVTAEGDVAEESSSTSGNQTATEKIDTVSSGFSTINEIQTESDASEITPSQSNITVESTESSTSRDNLTTAIYSDVITNVSSTTAILNSEEQTSAPLPTTIFTTTESVQESSSETPKFRSTETKIIEENMGNATGPETVAETHGSTRSITDSSIGETTTVQYEFVELTTVATNFTVSPDDVQGINSETTDVTSESVNDTSHTTIAYETVITDDPVDENQSTLTSRMETATLTNQPSTTPSFDMTTIPSIDSDITTIEDSSNATDLPVTESSWNTVTDIYNDNTTLATTTYASNTSHARVSVVTIGQNNSSEESTSMGITETISFTEEPTTITNIEVIVSSETTIAPTTVTQSTTIKIQSTSELPEFQILNTDVSLFVTVLIEGSWSDICPVFGNLRLSLANLLTEGTSRTVHPRNIILQQGAQCSVEPASDTTVTPILLYVVDDNGNFDYTMTEILPSLYKQSPFSFPLPIHSVKKVEQSDDEPSNNAIAVVAVSSVAFICLVLLAGLLFIMRKRQTRFNYGERCRPVSLDAFRVDSVSAYNSVRRKDMTRASKRSYGNPAFEDSSVTPSHPLNFAGLSSFCNDSNAINEEFAGIPQVTARMDELPAGSEVKNRYANVAPLPETRVLLQKINNEPLTEYINASYVRGPKNATKYYIACQAPMESTVSDFWRMIWEQQSKVVIMLTDIVENGVEKCVEYIPPSEVTDCHRLYGDYQVTLKKREAKEKYAISTLHLKNLENNTYREVSHIWYLWPTNGVPSNATGLIAILLEARALQRGAPGPIVIHCSPGTGRTGTLIALDLGIRQYEITRTIDVPRVVYTIRRDRAGAVQTKEQYAFIYKALNLYAAKLAGGALESM